MSIKAADVKLVPVSVQHLGEFTEQACRALGAHDDVAAAVSAHLVGADRAGHSSHGTLRLIQYAAEAERGDLVPAALPVVHADGATVVVDARKGFGHHSALVATEAAIATSLQHGIAIAVIRHCGHVGRLGHYGEIIAAAGLIGIATVGSIGPGVGAMVLPGTSDRFLAANPWVMAYPTRDVPVVVDVSTTMLAEGKITLAAARGDLLPPGCAVDADRELTRDPAAYFAGGGMLPLGGNIAGHKGFGLAIASAMLGALAMVGDAEPTLAGAQRPPGSTGVGELAGAAIVVIDPNRFGDPAHYRDLTSTAMSEVYRAERDGARVTAPGTPEHRSRSRTEEQVGLPVEVVMELTELGHRLRVDFPAQPPDRSDER